MSRWLAAFRAGAERTIAVDPKSENAEKGENPPMAHAAPRSAEVFSGFSTFSDFGAEEIRASPDAAPAPATPDDAGHRARMEGLRRAALLRPPSLPMDAPPGEGCRCACCGGHAWWCERVEPSGWRCATCYAPDHLAPDDIRELRT